MKSKLPILLLVTFLFIIGCYGPDGHNGRDGRDGRDGHSGINALTGPSGVDGKDIGHPSPGHHYDVRTDGRLIECPDGFHIDHRSPPLLENKCLDDSGVPAP